MKKLILALALPLAFFISMGLATSAQAQLLPGDILVVDNNAGTSFGGALFIVDPATGNRTVLSDFGDNTQGPLGGDPVGVALDSVDNILVIDRAGTGRGALFIVDPATGNRTLLSNFGDTVKGPLGAAPFGVTIDSLGNILVIDFDAGTSLHGALFIVDPATGNRTVLSDFGNNTQGTLGSNPVGVALDNLGNILVVDSDAGSGGRGALFIVDPATGNRTVLSDFGDNTQGTLGFEPFGVALDSSGNILVVDPIAGIGNRGDLFIVDPATGNRTLLSDFGDNTQGTLGVDPRGVALDSSGNILVVDNAAGTGNSGTLFSVDPATGNRTVLSDFGDNTQGPLGLEPFGVAVVPAASVTPTPIPIPTLSEWGMIVMALLLGLIALYAVRRRLAWS